MAVYEIEVVQLLVIDQGNSKYSPVSIFVSQTLAFTEIAKNYRRAYSASNFIHLAQQVTVRKSINHISVTQRIELQDSGHKSAGLQAIVQYLIIGQVARPVEYEIVTHVLSLAQAVIVDKCLPIFDTLVLTHAATVNVIRAIAVTHTLVIHSGGVGYVETDDRYLITLPTLSGPNAPECS